MSAQRKLKRIEPTRFEERRPLVIVGLSGRFTPETRDRIPLLWKRFVLHLGKIPGEVEGATYGVSSMEDGWIDYTAGVEAAEGATLPHGFQQIRLTAKTYAVFAHRGHVSSISGLVGAIGREWLPHSGWAIADGPQVVERYGHDFDPQAASGLIEIWIPLKD